MGTPVTIEWLAEHVVRPLGRIEGTVAAHTQALAEHKGEDAEQFEQLGAKVDLITTAQAVAAAAGKSAGKEAGARSGRWNAAGVAAGLWFVFEVGRSLIAMAQAATP